MLQSTTAWLRPVGDTGLGVNVGSKRRLLTIIPRLPNALCEALGVSRARSMPGARAPGVSEFASADVTTELPSEATSADPKRPPAPRAGAVVGDLAEPERLGRKIGSIGASRGRL